MRWLLFALAILSFTLGIMLWADADTPIKELQAYVVALIGAVFTVGSAIVEAVRYTQLEVRAMKEQARDFNMNAMKRYTKEIDEQLGRL